MLLLPILFSSVEFLSSCENITLFTNPITTTFDLVISFSFSHYLVVNNTYSKVLCVFKGTGQQDGYG
jgi:hypothetical protein